MPIERGPAVYWHSRLGRWLARYVWWHRLNGHRVHRGFNLLNPVVSVYWCELCDRTWHEF